MYACMYVYVYDYIYICMCVCLHMCILYIYIYIYIYTQAYIIPLAKPHQTNPGAGHQRASGTRHPGAGVCVTRNRRHTLPHPFSIR